VDWIRLSQDRDRWRAVVSAVMYLRVLAQRSYLVIGYISFHLIVLYLLFVYINPIFIFIVCFLPTPVFPNIATCG
jgi:hypothetical protein